MFEFVKIARFRVKNVYHRIEVVHQDPIGIAGALCVRRCRFEFILHFFEDAVGDSFDVCVGIAFADDKKICRCVAEFPKIELNDLFAFFIKDTLDDEVIKLFELRLF